MNQKKYITGFALSVLLTLTSFALVAAEVFTYWSVVLLLLALAVTQLSVQLYYFLHLSDEKKPYLKTHTFVSAAVVVFIIVFGSLWIFDNLSRYHGHNALEEDIDTYIQNEEAIYKEKANR